VRRVLNPFERRDRTIITRDRYAGRDLDYFEYDCGKLVIEHLRRMDWDIPKVGDWRSKLGLAKFIRRNGGSGGAVLDGWGLERMAPARAIIGDIVEMPGEPPFGAFGLCLGNGAVLAWSEHEVAGDRAAILRPTQFVAAWEV
jgi:hypothetical protein